ncbi:GTP-binding protein [Flavobacteriaceae bacterium]|nr:GTP-binding protein [Flavobacteriaceae bacterium]
MINNIKIPVVILNGFLGSGKTTLFKNLLNQSKKKKINVSAIVNDMSELDVDGELLGNVSVIEENNSLLESIHDCVLSSKIGIKKLDMALKKLLSNHNSKLIIIETSGSCHPLPLIEYFKHNKQLTLTKVFALVDSLMLAYDYKDGEQLIPKMQTNLSQNKRDTVNLLVEQIMFCSELILTKTDRIEPEKLSNIAAKIHPINPYVPIHSVSFGKIAIESLLEIKEYDYYKVERLIDELKPVLDLEAQTDKPYNLATTVIKDDRPFHPQRLWDTCHDHLGDRIFRSKGFFWLASRDKNSLLWNQAGGGINLEFMGSWMSGIIKDKNHSLSKKEIKILKTRLNNKSSRFGDRCCDLTVIGDESQIDQFTNALKSCFLTEEEIKLWESGHVFQDPWPKNIVKMVS